MSKRNKTFHESWYRIANQKISLRVGVRVQRQFYRDKKWYILQDSFSNQYFRIEPHTYDFIINLSGGKTVEEVWKEHIDRSPETAPGQGEVIELLAQLYNANLLQYNVPPDSEKLFLRYDKKKQRIIKSNLFNIMFLKIPLFDPESFLQKISKLIEKTISPLSAAIWMIFGIIALKTVIENFPELQKQSEGILSPSNLFLLYISMALIKTLHEFGHAFAIKRFGGEVHTMGIMFLMLNPLPYVDASAAWGFQSKWKRILSAAAGMIFELFIAFICIIIWANTGQGLVHSISYNIIFIASVSTLIFNLNPLIRFDGYYILSDLLDMPNLHQQAKKHLIFLAEKYLFKCPDCYTPAQTKREFAILTTFGILSNIYRITIFFSIVLFVADRFLLAGIIMAIVIIALWILRPLYTYLVYITTSPRLNHNRNRAFLITLIGVTITITLFFAIPFPYSFKAPGVVQATNYAICAVNTGGSLKKILKESGSIVQKDEPLVQLENRELDIKIEEAKANLLEAEIHYLNALQNAQSDLNPLDSRRKFFKQRVDQLNDDKISLVVRASSTGLWVAPFLNDKTGMFLNRGTELGQIMQNEGYTFISVISQNDIAQLFDKKVKDSKIRLAGQANITIPVLSQKRIPFEQHTLPSSALGFAGGGDIATEQSDANGLKTVEPFYEVQAEIDTTTKAKLLHGHTGQIKFIMTPTPLSIQLWLKIRQLVQKRYKF